jgi:putative membrane protein
MIVKKTLSLKSIYEFTGHHVLWLTAWMSLVTVIYDATHWKLITIPWLPLSLIGTAVAFYVGFKNNQSYGRLWEARIVWGAITNNSRKLAAMIKNCRSEEAGANDGAEIRKQIIYRHIGYLYQLREQLLDPTPWEHVSLHALGIGYYNRRRRNRLFNSFKEELNEIANHSYLTEKEKLSLQGFNNKATQILDIQSAMVQQLYQDGKINMMQQMELQKLINSFYDEQGRVERIKRTPFPRKYASFSFIFVCIFVFLLPFGIVGECSKLGGAGIWLSIPIGVIVGWVYVAMELIGDYSENPFEGLHNDIPMLSICRNIEIDLLQMMGETNIPKPIQAKEHILF